LLTTSVRISLTEKWTGKDQQTVILEDAGPSTGAKPVVSDLCEKRKA